uniref:C2H2-type domain-containing protein n=1 Tax=Oryzias melastigma TaxID=30732 RepID=A0A3B3BEG5_ORYME
MESPSSVENDHSEADLNNQKNFNVTESQDEEGNQHEESTSTTDEETDTQYRDQRKKRDRSHVQSVDSSHISESQCDSDVRKKSNVTNREPSPKEKISHLKSGKGTRTSNEGPYVCEECGKSFGSWFKFRIHMRTHKGKKHFLCKECDKHFKKTFFCKECDQRFSLLSSIGLKPFKCKECNTSFSRISHLKTHMRIHTGEKPFICEECDSSFSLIANLKRHMRIHTGEKPFKCKQCEKSFGRISNLKTHIITHTGERPFKCNECNRSFSRISTLKTHMRIHTREKPFTCKECDKSFSQLAILNAHMRTHTGEKPFSCKECDRSFCQLSHLQIHMRIHTGEKAFMCKECDKSYADKFWGAVKAIEEGVQLLGSLHAPVLHTVTFTAVACHSFHATPDLPHVVVPQLLLQLPPVRLFSIPHAGFKLALDLLHLLLVLAPERPLLPVQHSLDLTGDPGFIVGETPHSPDRDHQIHTKVHVVCQTAHSPLNVLPMRPNQFTPVSALKAAPESLLCFRRPPPDVSGGDWLSFHQRDVARSQVYEVVV